MSKSTLLACAAATALLAAPAFASTVSYSATSAVGFGSDHSVWLSAMPGGGDNRDFDFDPAGLLTLDSHAGTGSLTGSTTSQVVAGGFDISFDYSYDLSADTNHPKFKSENGSSVQSDTFFLAMLGGTMTGTGVFAGIDFTVSAMPTPADNTYAVQIGTEANNKNSNFGMANWFFVNAGSSCSNNAYNLCGIIGRQGDVNIDLAPVPLPASALLLMGALGGLGIARKRKS